MKDAGSQDYGILRWALDNSAEVQRVHEDIRFGPIIDQAIRCEGRKRGQGRHPSGVVISSGPTEECFTTVLDPKTKLPIIGVDMNEVAKMGGIKYDILGVSLLDKLKMVQDLVNGKTPRRAKEVVEHTEKEEE
jgi:DNA polymerase III alpha subunit